VSFLPGVIPSFVAWVYSEFLEYKRSSPCKEEHQAGGSKSSNTGVIVGSVIVGCVLLALLVVDGLIMGCKQWKWSIPQLKREKEFTFAEVNRYTNKFPETNNIGIGGYGMVVASIRQR
ncbi:hypothetical protein Tco_1480789, partial [Tanacetum coccineum]